MDKIEQKEKMLELNRFLEVKAREGLSAVSIKSYFWRVTDFFKYFDELTEESLAIYIETFKERCLSFRSLAVYQKILTQFMDFVNGTYPKEERQKKKKEGKQHPLLGIVLAESYVDSDGILRVKGSHVPALLSWCTAARGNIDFNYATTRKLRKEHNKKLGIRTIRKVPGLKSKY